MAAMRPQRSRWLLAALGMTLLFLIGSAGHAAEEKKKPETVKTQALSKETFAVLSDAQKAFDAKDYKTALQKVDGLMAKGDKLNSYEKGTLYSFYAAIYYAQDQPEKAMEAYKNVLRQPDLPALLRSNTLLAVAQLSFATGKYEQSIKVMNKWMETAQEVKPDSYMLLAQANFQLKRYPQAVEETISALRLAKQRAVAPKESWLALLRALYYEMKDYAKSAKVLEVLVQNDAKLSYYLQLAGMYGLMDRQQDQLAILHANYIAGSLVAEPELLNLARLYMVNEDPYSAAVLLQKQIEAKRIKEDATSLQLLAQALTLAKEHEAAMAVLVKLAALTGEAKTYIYLGQAHYNLGQWDAAADAFRSALNAKNVEHPEKIRMQLGTALFNAGKLTEAQAAFQVAVQNPDTGQQAAGWLKFISAELQRKKAIASSG